MFEPPPQAASSAGRWSIRRLQFFIALIGAKFGYETAVAEERFVSTTI